MFQVVPLRSRDGGHINPANPDGKAQMPGEVLDKTGIIYHPAHIDFKHFYYHIFDSLFYI